MLAKPKKIRSVYLDHAATTATDLAVVKAMQPYFSKYFGNPSSLYHAGRIANGAVNDARRTIAGLIHALPDNIIFTSGGTESDNLAIFGTAEANKNIGKHIISVATEHHAVLHALEKLKKNGYEITFIKVDQEGFVKTDDVISAIRPDTILISIMYANNEVGTIQPIEEIGRSLLRYRKEKNSAFPYFHSDACQAAGYIDLDVEKLHVDLMTVNGSKIYGPKGAGFLYVRRGVKITPQEVGGSQERRLRAGTENVPGIVGLTKAMELAQKNKDKEAERIRSLAKYFWDELQEKISKIQLNGPAIGNKRLSNNLNVSFLDIEGEAMLLYLDEYGVMCSTGSACTSDSLDPSHVLTAMGLQYEMSHGSIRFSLGKENTKQDIDYLMKYLPNIVGQLREMSPVNMHSEPHAKYK